MQDPTNGTLPIPILEIGPGAMVGHYRVTALLGRGGMGTVYLAERADEHYQQTVAVKVMARSLFHGDVAGRFRAERQILARLNHPNIARLLDGGEMPDGTPYLVMEYVAGVRIDEYCTRLALTTRERLPLLQQVCAAVQYAHQNLVVHRDLKPSNILVTADGTPKLLDFGIAKLLNSLDAEATAPLTQLRDRLLTPEHASPEQFRGEPIGTVTDVYSLGALFYVLLSGLHPYEIYGRPIREIEKLVCESSPRAPSERATPKLLARELRGDLDNIVLKAMHRDPERRYPSAAALSQDLQNYLSGRPVLARPDDWRYRTRKFLRRNFVAVSSAAVVALLVTTLVVFYTLRITAERDVAERERQTAASVSDFMIDVFRRANPNENRGDTVTVRAALDAAARRIDGTLADQPRLRLALIHNMSEAYSGLGLWADARTLLNKALEQERATFGNRSLEVARSLEALGTLQNDLGQFDAAATTFDEAWATRVALGRDHDAEAATLLNSSARNLRTTLHFAEAIARHRRAEALARSLTPPNPRVLGVVLQDFSVTASESGDQRSAERYARESLPLLKGEMNEGHDLYANSLAALANTLRKQFKLVEAEQAHRSFVEWQTQLLGKDHLLVGRAQNNFGALLRAKGDYVGSERALNEALRIYQLQPDGDLPDVATAYHNLGGLHHESGELNHSAEDLARALREIDQAISLKQRLGSTRSPLLVSSLLERAGVLREMGQLPAAQATLDEAQNIAAQKLDTGDPRFTLLQLEHGRFLLAVDRPREAEEELQSVVQSLRTQQEPIHLADALASLSDAFAADAHMAQARAAATEALSIRKRLLPASHPALAASRAQMTKLQTAEGQPQAQRTSDIAIETGITARQ